MEDVFLFKCLVRFTGALKADLGGLLVDARLGAVVDVDGALVTHSIVWRSNSNVCTHGQMSET